MNWRDAILKSRLGVAVLETKAAWIKRYSENKVVLYDKSSSTFRPLPPGQVEGFADWRSLEEVLNHASKVFA
jgi:cytochrome c5